MDANVDRNLLFGFLALQNDFISREDLIATVAVWLRDKSLALDEILLSRKIIPQEQVELLRALVRVHLARHNNDTEKSLAAISSLGSVREELARLGDAEIELSLAHMPALGSQARAALEETTTFRPAATSGNRFRVLRPHARGGLGEVSIAEDNELHRQVALKQIRAEYADDAVSRTRFVMEAEITGGLEHPGIVPVYGLGTYENGRPYYAMRFIRGDSLKEAIARFHEAGKPENGPAGTGRFQSLEFRKLLGRFIDVCDALEYAHSRGVLHRDLKPGNIMLGAYGETLVVDWGLAKPIGRSSDSTAKDEATLRPVHTSESTPTQFGQVVGTPGYMSPEQAAGHLDQLGPASDVYSLGATLYCVLTGQPPFAVQREELGATIRKVQAGEFRRPRLHNPRVPRPLEAICLKAMATSMGDRYSSPKALADDVERYLADEPVLAYAEPWPVRLRRWGRRNRTLVISSAAACVVLLIGLATVLALVARQNQTLDTKNRQLDTTNAQLAAANNGLQRANAKERQARSDAERERDRASAERRKAEAAEALALQNAAATRKVVEDFLVKIGDDRWSQVPQFEPLRLEMINKAVEHYRTLLPQSPNDAQLQMDAAMAFRRAANIHRMMNQFDAAKPLYAEAHALLDAVLGGDGGNERALVSLIDLLCDEADWLSRMQGPRAAEPVLRSAVERSSEFRDRVPESLAARRAEARCQLELAEIQRQRGQFIEALELAQKSADGYSAIADANQRDVLSRLLAVMAWNSVARVARDANQLQTAAAAIEQSVGRAQQNLKLNPREPNLRFTFASALAERGQLHLVQEDSVELGQASLDESLAALESLVRDFPLVASFRRKLAEVRTRYGEMLLRQGQLLEAEASASGAAELLIALDAEAHGAAIYQPLLGAAYLLRGTARYARGQIEPARSDWQQASTHIDRAKALNPESPSLAADAAQLERLLAATAD